MTSAPRLTKEPTDSTLERKSKKKGQSLEDSGLSSEQEHHRTIVRQVEEEYWPLLTSSTESIFIFLDEEHKVTADKGAELFGYEKFDFEALYPFFKRIIAPEDVLRFESIYYEKIVAERSPAVIEVNALKKNGSAFPVRILLVPISHKEPDLFLTLCFAKAK